MADNNEVLLKLKAIDELTPVMIKALQAMEANSAKMAESLDLVNAALNKNKDSADDATDKFAKFGVIFMAVKQAAEAAYAAFQKVSEFIGHAIDESLEAEKAFNRLQGALIGTGKYTKELSEELHAYAEATSAATGASAETIQTIIAQGIQMGLSVEKAKELEEASRKLAAATGETLESAFSMMQASLAGQSKALGKVLPQVKDLSAAQLKSGDAIDVVNRALTAQYQLYQGSYAAAIERAKTSINGVYTEIGNMIVQNPLVVKALNAFTDVAMKTAHALGEINAWLKANPEKIEQFAKALGIAVVVVGAITVAFSASAIAAAALAGAIAVLTSPITLVVAAVAALTYAFYKWPGLFDVMVGAIKTFIGMALVPMSLAFGALTTGIGTLVSVFNSDLGNSIKAAGDKLSAFRDEMILGGIEQAKLGVASIQAGESAKKGGEMAADAHEKAKLEATGHAKAALDLQKVYADFTYGTSAQRKEIDKQVSMRDGDLKYFTQYLENKKRLAISQAEEERMELNKIRAKALEGSGGSGAAAGKQVEVDAEIKKQADLKVLRDKGILDVQQYNAALLQSQEARHVVEFDMMYAHQMALADLMGTSESGYAMRQALEEERFQLELQNKMVRAQAEGATQEQINQQQQAMLEDHEAKKRATKEAQIENDIRRNQQLGNDWEVTLGRMRLAQEKDGKILGTIRGVQQTNEYKGTMNALNDLGSLRASKSKEAFELGKKAAIAQATIQTFQAAVSAYSSMAAIPVVGPVLGAVAAAAAIAAGFVNIQNINSQQFSQAHGGIDEIPQGMSNKTFLLDGGERVVQPEANKKLTAFLDGQGQGQPGQAGGGGTVNNLTFNYTGPASEEEARKMADMIIVHLRARSERGEPIISAKGVTPE